jgi:hypothetical protein
VSDFRFLNFSFCLVTVPSLADWEKDWQKNAQRATHEKFTRGGFHLSFPAISQAN